MNEVNPFVPTPGVRLVISVVYYANAAATALSNTLMGSLPKSQGTTVLPGLPTKNSNYIAHNYKNKR
jgi:hypothetical protein